MMRVPSLKLLLNAAILLIFLFTFDVIFDNRIACDGLLGANAFAQDVNAAATAAKDVATTGVVPAPEAPSWASDVKGAAIAGHNSWMLISSALVLFMTAPGLALFYCGLVRKKNVLSVIMQCMFLMCLMTVIWAIYGYSLAFGNGGVADRFIGGTDYLFMNGVQRTWNADTQSAVTPFFQVGGVDTPITLYSHMLFQGMFFIITPALICGAFAERMKFSAMVVFMILWGTFIYCPLAHWVWDGGLLAFTPDTETSSRNPIGGLDFAGGTVVHVSSGISALVACLMLGPRLGYGREPMPPHNLTYTAIGASMLWFGWFGLNAGSKLAADEITTSAFAVTHFSAAAGGLAWALIEWVNRGKPSLLGTSSGVVAGLVCITPAAGFVQPMAALIMGASAGIVCFFACSVLKATFKYDDSLDVFGIHGVGGALGALLTGVFATRACQNLNNGQPLGLLEGGPLLTAQIGAILVTIVFAAIGSAILLKIVDVTVGLRVSSNEERQGLDVQQHGEEGYIFL
jgi:Amt family ammonium transporter